MAHTHSARAQIADGFTVTDTAVGVITTSSLFHDACDCGYSPRGCRGRSHLYGNEPGHRVVLSYVFPLATFPKWLWKKVEGRRRRGGREERKSKSETLERERGEDEEQEERAELGMMRQFVSPFSAVPFRVIATLTNLATTFFTTAFGPTCRAFQRYVPCSTPQYRPEREKRPPCPVPAILPVFPYPGDVLESGRVYFTTDVI